MRLLRRSALRWLPEPAAAELRRARRAVIRTTASLRRPVTVQPFPEPPATTVRLLVGPANFAGQGDAWAAAAARWLPRVGSRSFAVDNGPFAYPSDHSVSQDVYRHPRWAHAFERHVTDAYTHVLMEAGRPLFGLLHGNTSAGDARVLSSRGVRTGLVAHGSDVRLPSRHAEREPDSPFRTPSEYSEVLEARARMIGRVFAEFEGPLFVSTPDLLLDVPRATWLPVVVEPERWAGGSEPLARERPIVVHAPSNPALKGSDVVDGVLTRLQDQGLLEYRRIAGVPAAQMPDIVRGADVVVDQLRMGLYGVAACEAMAAGRVVVGYVGDHVRRSVLEATGLEVPIIEATAATFEDAIRQILTARDDAAGSARAGVTFVQDVHDGRRSASALAPWLTGSG